MPSRHRVSSVCHQRCCGTFTDITILNSNNLPLPLPESEGGERSKPVDSALQSALQCSGQFHKSLISLVGAGRFELPTPCSRSKCATRLRYAPPDLEARRQRGPAATMAI